MMTRRVLAVGLASALVLAGTACSAGEQVWEGPGGLATAAPLARACDLESVLQFSLNDVQYVYDPDGAYPADHLAGATLEDTTLPTDAKDTGLRKDGETLWLAADGQAIFTGNDPAHVRQWPRVLQADGCL